MAERRPKNTAAHAEGGKPAPDGPATAEGFLALTKPQRNAVIARANTGDRHALAQLRALFDARPGLWEDNGNLANQVEASWLRTIAGEHDALFRESVEHTLRAMRAELAGPAPSPLERLLVDRILACWLQLHYVDAIYAQRLQKGLEWALTDHYQAWLDRAQKRHLSAIRTLAQVRRLLVPVVQVNIADQQVNIGAATLPEGPANAEG